MACSCHHYMAPVNNTIQHQMIVNNGEPSTSPTSSHHYRSKLLRQPSGSTCDMLTPSSRSVDESESVFGPGINRNKSLLDALSIGPLDDDDDASTHSRDPLSSLLSLPKNQNHETYCTESPHGQTKVSSNETVPFVPSSPLRTVARKISWSNMDAPMQSSRRVNTNTTSPQRKQRRPKSPSSTRRTRHAVTTTNESSLSPRKKTGRKRSSSLSNLKKKQSEPDTKQSDETKHSSPLHRLAKQFSLQNLQNNTTMSTAVVDTKHENQRHSSPLQRLAKQFSLKNLRNFSPLKSRVEKQTSMINLNPTTASPKKTKPKQTALKKQESMINFVGSKSSPKKTKRTTTSLSKHISEANLLHVPQTSREDFSASDDNNASVSMRVKHRPALLQSLSRRDSSSRSFRPPSLRSIRPPSLKSLCSGAETAAVDTSTKEAALYAEEQVRSCSPMRTVVATAVSAKDYSNVQSTLRLNNDCTVPRRSPKVAHRHSQRLVDHDSSQNCTTLNDDSKGTSTTTTISEPRSSSPLRRSSCHGSSSPKRKPRANDPLGANTYHPTSRTRSPSRSNHPNTSSSSSSSSTGMTSTSSSPLRNSRCRNSNNDRLLRTPISPKIKTTHRTSATTTTSLSLSSSSLHEIRNCTHNDESSPRKLLRDMTHPPPTRLIKVKPGCTSNSSSNNNTTTTTTTTTSTTFPIVPHSPVMGGGGVTVVPTMTPTSLRKKYTSMASLADEYEKIVQLDLE